MGKVAEMRQRAHESFSGFLTNRLGFSRRQRTLTWHYLHGLRDQVLAVCPISILQVRSEGDLHREGAGRARRGGARAPRWPKT